MHDPEKPNAIPMAYALKGYSLNTDTLRNMIDAVCDKCLERNIKIICEAMDVQWSRLVVRSVDGTLLTRIQYAKDVWNIYCQNSKAILLETLHGYSKIAPVCLQALSEVAFPRDQIVKVGNVQVEQKHNKAGNRKLYIRSVGFPGIEIPMVQHITSTKVQRAWLNKYSETKEKQERDDTTECESVIEM